MLILGHRGYWKTVEEKNSHIALERCFKLGYGTETDVRDHDGELVIAHDPPVGTGLITLDELLDMARTYNVPLALNIKSDGLATRIADALKRKPVPGSFVFDMSIPDMLPYLKQGVPAYTRLSEYEEIPVLLSQAEGIWLDIFKGIWFDKAYLEGLLSHKDKKICFVSPELHGRDPQELWHKLRDWDLMDHPNLSLCTDIVEDAAEYFNK